MDYPTNVLLLLLQLLLQRQQALAHQDKSLDLTALLREPIVDKEVLAQFQSHKLVKMYAPELCSVHLRILKSLVADIFLAGLPGEETQDEVTVISLANHYYSQRIEELTLDQLPRIRHDMAELLQGWE